MTAADTVTIQRSKLVEILETIKKIEVILERVTK